MVFDCVASSSMAVSAVKCEMTGAVMASPTATRTDFSISAVPVSSNTKSEGSSSGPNMEASIEHSKRMRGSEEYSRFRVSASPSRRSSLSTKVSSSLSTVPSVFKARRSVVLLKVGNATFPPTMASAVTEPSPSTTADGMRSDRPASSSVTSVEPSKNVMLYVTGTRRKSAGIS